MLIWMMQTLIWLNLQRDGTGNRLSNIKDTFAENSLLQRPVLHQSMCIFQSPRLVSQVHMMAGQNVKKKFLMYQVPIKMLKQYAILNSRLHNLKIYSLKGYRKTSQRWIVCIYLAKTAVLNTRIFRRRYWFSVCIIGSHYKDVKLCFRSFSFTKVQ